MITHKWSELVQCVILGANNQPALLQSVDNQLKSSGFNPENFGDKSPLFAASVWYLTAKAGEEPAVFDDSLQKQHFSAKDHPPVCSKNWAKLLEFCLKHNHEEVIEEIFEVLDPRRASLPDGLLVDLLNFGVRQAHLHAKISHWIGAKGRWLANFYPDWAYAREALYDFEDLGVFLHGKLPKRAEWFARFRYFKPTEAFELLRTHWAKEDSPSKARFLAILALQPLHSEWEFFKNCALEPNQEVQKIANGVLSHALNTPITQFLLNLLPETLGFDPQKNQWKITPNPELVKILQQKGVFKHKPAQVEGGESGEGVFGLLAAIPFSFWSKTYPKTRPKDLLEAALGSDWKMSVFGGLVCAIRETGDQAARLALHKAYLNGYDSNVWRNLPTDFVGQGLSDANLQQVFDWYVEHAQENFGESHPIIALFSNLKHWTTKQTKQLIELWYRYVRKEMFLYFYSLRVLLQRAGYAAPPALADKLRQEWERVETDHFYQWQKEFRNFLSLLEQRQALYE